MLLHCIRAENRKLHHSVIWLVFLIVPPIGALYGTYNYIINIDILQNGWYDLWTQHTLFYALFFFAPLIAVYSAYLWRLEHFGHNWNAILSAPVHPVCLFVAKFVVVIKLEILTQIWVGVLYVLCGKLWAGLAGWPPPEVIFWLLRGVLGGLPVIALQLLLSMLIRSFAVPVFVSWAGSIPGMLLGTKWQAFLWPYSLMLLGMNSNKVEDTLMGRTPLFVGSCMLMTVLFGLLAHLLLTKRDVRT